MALRGRSMPTPYTNGAVGSSLTGSEPRKRGESYKQKTSEIPYIYIPWESNHH